jgi:hypothetical protein
MTDRDRFELEMSPGMQPQGGLGDRVLVGLALLVLIGAAVIAVGKVLPDPDQVAQGSEAPSARPERTSRPSPTPRPPRVATIEDPDLEISPEQPSYQYYGWVRALNDIVIRSAPDPDATEVGNLWKGDVASASSQDHADDGSGWLLLDESGGWIPTVVGGVEQVRRYEYPRYRSSGWINTIIAGPDGFVALVQPPGGPDSYEPARTAISTDGASWRSASKSLVDLSNGGWIAWGPAGWLAVTYVTDGIIGRILIWSSGDGFQWTRLGMLAEIDGHYVGQLLGNDDGYLLETFDGRGGFGSGVGTLWSSTDGQTWVESTDPVLDRGVSGERRIVALDDGFYLWDANANPESSTLFAAYSADGQAWSELDNGPDGVGLQLTDFADGIVAIDLNRTSLAPRVWSAVVADGQVSWIRESAADAAFQGAIVRQLVSDGTRVYAFGWDLATDEPLVWTGNGVNWVRSALPDAFGGIPGLAAAGPGGVVVVGHRQTLRGDNPIFWHRTATGSWLPESEPIMAEVPDPTIDCQALPAEFLEYAVVDAAAVISCHGATPFTFRAFSVACSECSGTLDGNREPAWLLNPNQNQLFLAPFESLSNWTSTAVLGPSLIPPDPAWTGAWLEITGHFDDPAAPTCRMQPQADSIQWWTGLQSLVDQCRMTFVVTDVKVVDGP